LDHAYYSTLTGHAVVDFEPIVIEAYWFGYPMIVTIKAPTLVETCRCKRFISKKEAEEELIGT
jgi:hypothetical protein